MTAKRKVVKHKELEQHRFENPLDRLKEHVLSRPCVCKQWRAELAQKKVRRARRKRGR